MRRPLNVLALALMLLGTEVATGTVSLAFARIGLGVQAALAGNEGLVSKGRNLTGLSILFVGLAVYVGLLWAEGLRHRVKLDRSACPQCGGVTKRVRRRIEHKILSKILEMDVTRRQCNRCGWSGLAA